MNNTDVGDKTKIFHKGQPIYREGQSSNEAYIIKQGAVGLYRLAGNRRVSLGLLRPGQIFGEMGVIAGEKRSSSAEALEYTEVIVLDQGMLQSLLLKSPRPVQIITGYLIERVRELNALVPDRPSSNTFASVCNIILLAWRGAAKTTPKNEAAQMSAAELSKTIKEILLITQAEIDAILDVLAKVHIIDLSEIKGTYYRKDPLLGTMKKSSDFVKERLLSIPDADRFARVSKNLAKDYQDQTLTDLEFVDLDDFTALTGGQPDVILKRIGYGEVPPGVFYFHKPTALAFASAKGAEFFQKAKRPRMKAEDLQSLDDLAGVDNSTLEEALSKLGFYKVSIAAASAGAEARAKIFHNLSKKIAGVVKEEIARMEDIDPGEAADVEDELLSLIKSIKGLTG